MSQPLDNVWRKSTRSNGNGGDCVEVADAGEKILVRDSKDVTGPALSFSRETWAAFIESTKASEFDL